jgi:hypothetical protein
MHVGCCIVEGSGIGIVLRSSASGSLRRAHAWDRRLAYAILRWRLRENRYAHPRARPWSALVRWTGSGVRYARTRGLTTSLRRTTGTRERCRWPARPPPDRRATMAGSGVLGPIPKAESAKRSPNAPLHPIPSPPKFNRTPARAGTANEITARFRFSKRKNTSLMR